MGHEYAGRAALPQDRPHLRAKLRPQRGIQIGEWLIQQQYVRFRGQRAGQRHALLLPAGEFARPALHVISHTPAGQDGVPDCVEHQLLLAQPSAVESVPPPAPELASPAVKPETERTPKSAKTAAPAKSPAVMTNGWTVQVGAFSQLENAKRLQEKLKKKGFSATLDPPAPAKGKTVRVEVGPYKDASAAQTAQARIENEFGIKGVVRKP